MKIISDIKNINKYILNPKHTVEEKYTTTQKWRILFSAILYKFAFALIIVAPIWKVIDEYIILEYTSITDKWSITYMLFIIAFFLPFIEELIFRLPLKYNRNYFFQILEIFTFSNLENFWFKYFKSFFYIFSFGFALVHISNYNNTQPVFYLFAPLIVLSQGLGGLIYGYIRMNLGFWWSFLTHGLFNFLILICLELPFHNTIHLEKNNDTINLKVQKLTYYDSNEKKEVNFDKNTITSIHWNDETIQKLLDTLYNKQYKTFDNHLAKVKLETTKPISKKEFLEILKEEYRIEKKQ